MAGRLEVEELVEAEEATEEEDDEVEAVLDEDAIELDEAPVELVARKKNWRNSNGFASLSVRRNSPSKKRRRKRKRGR
jgi:hypothetical protein